MLVFANIVQPLIDVTESILVFIHDHVVSSWGLSIIGLTVVVRLALLPLTLKQSKSMQEMQRIAPEIKALQAKYKEDKQRLNQEMMKLYQEHGVNPFASCLPLVAQLPIFISLFYMLRKDLKLDICGPESHILAAAPGKGLGSIACDKVDPGSAQFLFINDLTATATGATLVTLVVLYVGSQLASSLLMTATMDKTQRRIMLALPLVFVAFIINFPAGLLVYWITTNLWTIVQQYIVKRIVGPIRPATAGGPAPDGGKPAGPPDGGKDRGGTAAVDGDGDGDGSRAGKKEKVPAAAGARARTGKAPPPPPRKRKKRSGRRR